jgi:Fe-S cluster biogenesis protein NfuA
MSEQDELAIDRIEEVLAELRPFFETDGGDITLESVSDKGVATVKMHGACRDCSMSEMTLKTGVEEAIKKVAPNIREVVAI